MNMEYRKLMVDAGGAGGAGSVAKDFDYAQVETALESIDTNISNILAALSKQIVVTSYTGDAQAEVTAAVNSIRKYLETMETPLKEMRGKINEVKDAYAKSESSIKSQLSNIAAGTNNQA